VIRLGLMCLALWVAVIIFSAVLGNFGVFLFGPLFGPWPWYAALLNELMFMLLLAGIILSLFGLQSWLNGKGARSPYL
jgi:hypothetical protein